MRQRLMIKRFALNYENELEEFAKEHFIVEVIMGHKFIIVVYL